MHEKKTVSKNLCFTYFLVGIGNSRIDSKSKYGTLGQIFSKYEHFPSKTYMYIPKNTNRFKNYLHVLIV